MQSSPASSTRRVSANRRNAQKSTGPKSAIGKARASTNARRHGLGAAELGGQDRSPEIERIVELLCAGATEPDLIEQAMIIAETELLIRRVRAARVALIESCCRPPS